MSTEFTTGYFDKDSIKGSTRITEAPAQLIDNPTTVLDNGISDGRFSVKVYNQILGQYSNVPILCRNILRNVWREHAELEPFPQPVWGEIHSVKDFFAQAKQQVNGVWNRRIAPTVKDLTSVWSDQPEVSEDLRQTLKDATRVNNLMAINYYGAVEGLNSTNPEAWRTLLALSSERELFYMNTARRWIRDNLNNPEFVVKTEEMNMNPDELRLAIDLSEIAGRMFDLGFMRQAAFADNLTANNKPEAPIHDQKIYDRVYPAGNGEHFYSDADVFTHEIGSTVLWFNTIADSIDTKIAKGILPASKDYDRLAAHLRLLAQAHQTEGQDPQKVGEAWEKVENNLFELLETNCPVFVFHSREMSVGDGNIVDLEERVNIRTSETRADEEAVRIYVERISNLNKQYQFDSNPPLFVIANQPSAHGPNTYWRTRGQEVGGRLNIIHPEPCEDVAKLNELPLIEALIPGAINADAEARYLHAAVEETVRHELGHSLAPSEDSTVRTRIGNNAEMKILEELKAETVNMLMLNVEDMGAEEQYFAIMAKIGVSLDALKNKSSERGSSGERYYVPALAVVDRLLDCGTLIRNQDGTYKVENIEIGIRAIASIAEDLLTNYYCNPDCTPNQHIPWKANELRDLANTKSNVAQLLSDLNEK